MTRGARTGAVAVVGDSSGRDLSAAGARYADGPLTLAWTDGPERYFDRSGETACLLEGALYLVDGARSEPGGATSPAHRLAEAYSRLGPRCLDRVRGEYWALIWDRKRQEGIVVTDQMGSRSPYFARDGGDLVVASEIPELLTALRRRPDPDQVAIAHWIATTVPPPGSTMFAGVRRLPAGHSMALGQRSGEPSRYWSPRYEAPIRAPREELVARLGDSLMCAVTRRADDAESTGVLLSGGLDSSAVAALAGRARLRVHGYSAVFPGRPTVDEAELIDRTVRDLGMPSTRLAVRGGSVIAGALSYMTAWQQPPTSPNLFFWEPLLDCAADDGMRIMLDGEGGDELFGFSPYLLADRLRHGRLVSAVGLLRRWPSRFARATPRAVWFRSSRFGLRGAMPPSAHVAARKLRRVDAYAPPGMIPEVARAWLESEESSFAWKRLPGPRWWAWLVESVIRGAGPSLVYEQSRRRAALSGLVARHPLVDVDVIELMLRIPPELAFDRRYSRPLLREALAGLLPDEVRLRKAKSNFDAVFTDALAGPDFAVACRLLGAADAEVRAHVDFDAIRETLPGAAPPGPGPARRAWGLRLWRLVTLECWLRSQSDPAFLGRLAEREELVPTEHELVP
jgi:asparagine synthase (glutamine-hydrolysing)